MQGEAQIPWSGGLILTARTSSNAFTLGAEEFNAYLKEEGLSEVLEWRRMNGQTSLPGRERYSKYAKSLVTSGGNNNFHTKPVGLLIEIVPEMSPGELKAGDRLPLRVLFRGKPAAGLQIEAAWAGPNGGKKVTIAGRTDRNGRMEVPLGMPGKWRIHTLRMERCADSDIADWESYWASLTFEN